MWVWAGRVEGATHLGAETPIVRQDRPRVVELVRRDHSAHGGGCGLQVSKVGFLPRTPRRLGDFIGVGTRLDYSQDVIAELPRDLASRTTVLPPAFGPRGH